VRSPHTGPPLLDELLLDELLLDELLEDEDEELLLEEELELAATSPLLEEDAPLLLDVCPVEFVPDEVTGIPPVPPAPPRFSSSEPPGRSVMVPVQALSARARAEKANRIRRCMIGDCTALEILIVTDKSDCTFEWWTFLELVGGTFVN
jgi:hypothetical protein